MPLLCSGTFAEEKDTEEIAYGLVYTVDSWDPIYTQVATPALNPKHDHQYMFRLTVEYM